MIKYLFFLAFNTLQRDFNSFGEPKDYKYLTDDDYIDIINATSSHLVLFRRKKQC